MRRIWESENWKLKIEYVLTAVIKPNCDCILNSDPNNINYKMLMLRIEPEIFSSITIVGLNDYCDIAHTF